MIRAAALLALLLALPAGQAPAQPASAASAAVPAQAAASGPAVFAIDARLPPVTLGRDYPPLPLVRSGTERYRFEASPELAPSGLVVGPGAVLQGQARSAGSFRFTLTVRERDGGAVVAKLPFVLQVRVPAPPRAAASAPPTAPAPAPAPAALPVPEPAQALYWQLDGAALKPLIADPERPGSLLARCQAAAPDDEALQACAPAAEAWLALAEGWLGPLLGRAYPTEALFLAALRDQVGPQRPGLADLVPEAELLALAARSAALADALPVRWQGDGCGCGAVGSESLTYGLFPFWTAGKDRKMVDFSAFARIGVQGLFLQTDGTLVPHRHWDDDADDGLRVAQRYATRLDLVLFRQRWEAMLQQDEARLAEAAQRAAREAMLALEASRLDRGIDRLARALQWPWQPPEHLYDGLTVWLDYRPQAGPGQPPSLQDRRFNGFAGTLVKALIAEMRVARRDLSLQLVVPADAMADPQGAWSVDRLLQYLQAAAPEPETEPAQRQVRLRVLALLAEPVRQTDWDLRRVLYESDTLNLAILARAQVDRYRTLDLLTSVLMPVTLVPARVPEPVSAGGARLKKRLADHDWQFGGVSVWPLPQSQTGPEPMARLMHQSLRGDDHWEQAQGPVALTVCPWVCPNRAPVRMAFLGLVLLGAAALALFVGNCRVNALGWPYLGGVAAVGALTALLGMALLTCDPDLHPLRESNLPLALLLVLLLGGTMAVAFQRRVAKP